MSFVHTVGSARRSQGIFTYGTGAIVDFTTGSFMPLGLQQMDSQWAGLPPNAHDAIVFHEPRLQRLLGIKEFRGYPIPSEGHVNNYGEQVKKAWGVPCIRFPSWLECPQCHRIGRVDDPFEEQPDGHVRCTSCSTNVNPVRFIVACRHGHIDDFPWIEWAHEDREEGICNDPMLQLDAKGTSAALGDLVLKCTNCRSEKGLGTIFRPWAMQKWGCRGRQPWLGTAEKCKEEVLTLQRGGSNVHFPVTASMLSIPPASDAIAKVLERKWAVLSSVPESALLETLRGVLENEGINISAEAAADWVRRRKSMDSDEICENESSARHQEFESLCLDCPSPAEAIYRPEFENVTFRPPTEMTRWVDMIAAVPRVREVRAYCGFTRIQPNSVRIEDIPAAILDKRISPLSNYPTDWRPAVEVRGEGIFVRLSEAAVKEWSQDHAVLLRAETIHDIFESQCDRDGHAPPYRITPRALLVHSLAHVLVRRLSLDCGYSSASLRERLYISDGDEGVPEMAGILIYTASPDSDGSLGGLVSLATPDRIGDLIRRAVRDAEWCGNDPVCSETDPRISGDRLSGAACHNCLLVPETACERFNRQLDRVAIVGFHDPRGADVRGYFADFPIE